MLDLTKEYKTRGGHKVLSIHYFEHTTETFCIYAEIQEADEIVVELYTRDGSFYSGSEASDYDLVEVLPTIWVNVYKDCNRLYLGATHTSEKAAKEQEHIHIILATVEVPQ